MPCLPIFYVFCVNWNKSEIAYLIAYCPVSSGIFETHHHYYHDLW